MGLEVGQFIAELVDTNPIGASDTVSQGDDHLRLIKLCIQGSFPAFVGTTAVPASVALTEAQINILIDAAIKNIPQTIGGLWTFTGNNLHQGLEVFENLAGFEDNAGNEVMQTIAANLGSLLIADFSDVNNLKAGFRDPAEFAVIAGGSLTQAMEGQVASYAAAAGVVNVPTLLPSTNITLLHKGSGDITLTQSGTTINWLDGLGALNTGNRTIAVNSVVHLRWSDATNIDIWGNGIT